MSSGRRQPFCLGLNVLIIQASYNFAQAMTALDVQISDFIFFSKDCNQIGSQGQFECYHLTYNFMAQYKTAVYLVY